MTATAQPPLPFSAMWTRPPRLSRDGDILLDVEDRLSHATVYIQIRPFYRIERNETVFRHLQRERLGREGSRARRSWNLPYLFESNHFILSFIATSVRVIITEIWQHRRQFPLTTENLNRIKISEYNCTNVLSLCEKLTRIGEKHVRKNIVRFLDAMCHNHRQILSNMNARKKYHRQISIPTKISRPVKEFLFFLYSFRIARIWTVKNTIRYSINHAKRIERYKSGLCAMRVSYTTSILSLTKARMFIPFPLWVTPCETDLAAVVPINHVTKRD